MIMLNRLERVIFEFRPPSTPRTPHEIYTFALPLLIRVKHCLY